MNALKKFLKHPIAKSAKCHRQTLLFTLLFAVVVMSQSPALGLETLVSTESASASAYIFR